MGRRQRDAHKQIRLARTADRQRLDEFCRRHGVELGPGPDEISVRIHAAAVAIARFSRAFQQTAKAIQAARAGQTGDALAGSSKGRARA